MSNEFSPETIEQEVGDPELLFLRPELLAHPTLPEPLHGLNPRTIMGKKSWDEVRKNVYSLNNYHCFACGVYAPWDEVGGKFAGEQKLHAHECYSFDYKNRSAELTEIVALCPLCHSVVHIQRSQALFDKGVHDVVDMWTIFVTKDRLLGFDRESWADWTLRYKDKDYQGKFKNREEWEKHYEGN